MENVHKKELEEVKAAGQAEVDSLLQENGENKKKIQEYEREIAELSAMVGGEYPTPALKELEELQAKYDVRLHWIAPFG